jgi:glucose-1-phosphate adenylyltransferase
MAKVLFVIPSLHYGGAAKQLVLLATGLPAERFRRSVCVLGQDGPFGKPLRAAGVEVEALGWNKLFDVRPFWRLRRLVREQLPDVVHAWQPAALRALALAGGPGPGRLVVSAPLPPQKVRGAWARLDLRLLRRAHRVVASCQGEADACRRLGLAVDQLATIPPGVAVQCSEANAGEGARYLPSFGTSERPVVCRFLGLPDHARLLVGVGPLEPHKGFRDAVWAFDILRYLYNDLHLVLVGAGLDRERLRQFRNVTGTAGRVHLVGPQADAGLLLAQAEVVWVPSRAPGGINVALEAMALGRPVVAFRQGCLAEVIADGQTGFLVAPGDKAALARQTRALLEDPGKARLLGAAGRRRAVEQFAAPAMVRHFAHLYDTMAGENPGSPLHLSPPWLMMPRGGAGTVNDVLTLILAGGKGTRLEPLTRDRAKPAVPFGGLYRIVDFTLSNCINSGLRRMLVLTQYKARSLDRHISAGWGFLSRELGDYIEVLPPQQRIDEHWYKGTADAIYQNIYSIEKEDPKYVLILAGDHIYKMDYGDMIRGHLERGADVTIGCIPVPLRDAVHFGVMQVDGQDTVIGFQEKPRNNAVPMPDSPEHCLASMGIYMFTARPMYELLCQDATRADSDHDFGKNIIPGIIDSRKVFAFRFRDKNRKAVPYWRDVGTLDAYYQANMDLVEIDPVLNLYDKEWPIRTFQPQLPPPKFVFSDEGPREHARRGEAHDSMVCQGCIVSGGHVRRSILSPNVRINSYTVVENSILFDGVQVGRHSRVRRAIIDKEVQIPPHTTIGYDLGHDRHRGFLVTEQGVVVIAKAELPETFAQRAQQSK